MDTTTAGAKSGVITLLPASDGKGFDNNGVTPLQSQTVTVSGSVFREAAASVALPSSLLLHVGDSGIETLAITNSAPNDGYSENLRVAVANTTGGIVAPPPVGEIAPGQTGTVSFDLLTANAGVDAGTIVLDFASDGIGIDGYAATPIGTQTIDVTGTRSLCRSMVSCRSPGVTP